MPANKKGLDDNVHRYEYNLADNIPHLRTINSLAIALEVLMILIDVIYQLPLAPAFVFLLLFCGNYGLLRFTKRYLLSANLFLFLVLTSILLCIVVYGGLYSVALLWMPFFCIFGFYLLGNKGGFFWSMVGLTVLPITAYITTRYNLYQVKLEYDQYAVVALIVSEAVAITAMLISMLFVNSRHAMVHRLYEEKSNSADLLYDKKVLLASICHDLRSPLAVIKYATDLQNRLIAQWQDHGKLSHEDKTKFESFSARHLKAVVQLFELLDQTMQFEAMENGKFQLAVERVELDEVVERLKTTFAAKFTDKNLRFETNLAQPVVVAERSSLTHNVLGNLLFNAIKFSHPGHVITLSSVKKGNFAEVSIRDTGIGIPPEVLKDIFSLERKTTRLGTLGEKGTGFGLPIVKRFVETYQGKIHVCSNCDPQKGDLGTTFTLVLPLVMPGS